MIRTMKVTIMISHIVAALYMTQMGSVSARSIGLIRNNLSSSIRMAYSKQQNDVFTNANIQNIFGVAQGRDPRGNEFYDEVWDTSMSLSMSLSMSMAMPTDLKSDFPSFTPSFAPSIDTGVVHLPSDIPSYVRGASTSVSPSGTQVKDERKETANPTQSPTIQLITRVEGESPKPKDTIKPRALSNIVATIVVLVAASVMVIGFLAVRRRMRSNLMTNVEDMSSNDSLSSSVNDNILGTST
jgi:hypothetical protein